MKTKILAVILAVAMIVSMLPMSAVVSAAGNDFTEDFADISEWETVDGNHYASGSFTLKTDAQVLTLESEDAVLNGKTVLAPAQGASRGGMVTTIKDANWNTSARVQRVTAEYYDLGSLSLDANTGIYAVHINDYNGVLLRLNTASGYFNVQWYQFTYYESTSTSGNGSYNCKFTNLGTAKSSADKIMAAEWVTIEIDYDYSKISENQLGLSCLITDVDKNEITSSVIATFDDTEFTVNSETKTPNAYSEGFKVGIASRSHGSNIGGYFDSFAVEFEKTAADLAADFRTNNDYALDLPEINSSDDFDAVEAAIAEYETLGEDVKDLLSTEIAKLNFLMNDFDATCFKEEHADVLELETVSTNAQASAVLAAIAAYGELDGAVKAFLTEQITKLNELKATIKITEFDFEDETLFAEVWESLPKTGDIQTAGQLYADETDRIDGVTYKGNASTKSSEAQIIEESEGSENHVLKPEYRSMSRKRKVLTVKDEYSKDAQIASFSTDMKFDSAIGWDDSTGIYLNYENAWTWSRIEFFYGTVREQTGYFARVSSSVGTNDADITAQANMFNNLLLEGLDQGEVLNVKVDYEYTENGTDLTFTFTTDSTTVSKEVSTTLFNGDVKIGYAASSASARKIYFDNFALTYASEEPVVTPEELAAAFKAANQAAFDLTAIEDEAQLEVVNTTLAAYEALDEAVKAILADDVANLNTLKTAYETAKANKAAADQFVADYEDTIALEEIKNDAELGDVNAMLDAYAKLDEAVKDIVALDVSKFEGLKAVYIAAKEATEAAEAFNDTYGGATTLTEITNDEELAAVEAMLAAYAQLDEAVQKLVNVDVAKYQAMVEAYETEKENKDTADKFLTDHKDALNAEKINSDEELEAVKAMLQAYEALSDAAKAFAGNVDVAKYEAMIAVYNTEKANKATAAEYEKTHAAALALKVIENDDELAAADAALADYAELTDGVKAYLAEDIEARLTGMTGAYRAEKAAQKAADDYKDAYKTTLEINKIRSEEANALVDTAIEAYNALSEAAQAKLGAEIATLNALKAEYAEFLAKVYTPTIKGATIRREGTQTIGFKCAINNLREDLAVAEYGLIVTANSYLTEGLVKADDLKVGTTNKYVQVASSTEVGVIEEGYEFTANIGNISSDNYGVRYVALVYVKYADGTVDYSETSTKSVIGVAKAISKFAFEKQITGINEIVSAVEGDTVVWTYDPNTDNGVKVLEYLEANNVAIVDAFNAQ